jgi:hypothetical protein
MMRLVRMAMAMGIAAFGYCGRVQAHESPVDPVSRTLTFWVDGIRLHIRYEEQISERSALLELHAMDRNRDGIVQDRERDSFLADKASRLAEGLKIQGGSVSLKVTSDGPVALRRGWRQVYSFAADLSAIPTSLLRIRLSDLNSHLRPGPFRWTIGRPSDLPATEGAPAARITALRAGSSGATLSMQGGEDRVDLEFVP